MNLLQLETSPYLLQHSANPVNWNAWNKQTLIQAQEKNKLIIISIGYSACHWCHVMEQESFEDKEVAKTMNAHFINIKVDREEHPNVDAIYMKAVQLMTGHGGWPLNIVALPDGRPVWGGTYFKKEEWIDTLEQLEELYQKNPERLFDYAEKLHQGIIKTSVIQKQKIKSTLDQGLIRPLIEKWKRSFDLEFGGMARAPKFMMPNNIKFLLRYAFQNNDTELLNFVNLTLTKMAYGGLFDTVGGGFSRYSVDLKWHIPHFEKMLYDNGQLVSLYADAFKLTKNPLYKNVIEKTLKFVNSELQNEEGGFYCALDADSLNDKGVLEEGAFYVWTKKELKKILNKDYNLFSKLFNINEFGYWEEDHFVLIQNETIESIAEANTISVSDLKIKKETWEQLLLRERENRTKPRLDDKCLTSWNGIMLKGYIDAYKALGEDKYLKSAFKNAAFILQNLWSKEGHLNHNFKNGKSSINGYLEDYCFLIESFIALYEVTFDEKWLLNAKKLTDYCFDNFYDEENEFFSFTSKQDPDLIALHFETEDNVIPSSNSVMANNLYQLGIYFSNSYYEKICLNMLENIIPKIDFPSAYSNWLNVFLNYSPQNRELAICGEKALDFGTKINAKYFPFLVLAGSSKHTDLPFLKDRYTTEKTNFYICQNKTCDYPIQKFEDVETNLQLKYLGINL